MKPALLVAKAAKNGKPKIVVAAVLNRSAAPAKTKAQTKAPNAAAKSSPAANSREKLNVKDGGTKSKTATPPPAKDAKGKGAKAAAGKKPVVPPPPPRKIQVVQLTTLKPGARGTKAPVPRLPANEEPQEPEAAAKKRRSAELTKQQLDHFKELLQQRRARLSHDLSLMQDEALKVTAQDNSSDSVADTGTDNYEQDFTLGLIESEEALAREVDQALLRVDENTFGVCETCQTPIPLARLEIVPFTRNCVACQQKREGQA